MIDVESLCRTYRSRVPQTGRFAAVRGVLSRQTTERLVLDRVSFTVPTGGRVALIGRNGAGKSTTVKILAGVLTPTSGRCEVAGLEPRRDRIRHASNIGVVFGQRSQLWWDLPVQESFRILSRIYELPKADVAKSMRMFDEVLDMGAIAKQTVRTLSLGQRIRAEIAAAMFHMPRLLLLDEPTIGLDLLLKEAVHELVNRVVHDRGTTLMLTSHDVSDIGALCDRALVLDQARIVYDGDLVDLTLSAPSRTVRIDWSEGPHTDVISAAIRAACGSEVTCTALGQRRLEVSGPRTVVGPEAILAAIRGMATISDFVAPDPTLTDVLRTLYASKKEPVVEEASR